MIPEDEVVDFVAEKHDSLKDIRPSFFEWTVGLAFFYFAKEEVDIAVIETGLGGRLDSTNVISPLVSVITNIGLDHTQFLGDKLDLVAVEKAGIIKPNIPVVIGETQEEIKFIFENVAADLDSPIVFADQELESIALSGLVNYQKKNAQTATVAVKELRAFGFEVSNNNLVKGIDYMAKNTGLRGRWEILHLKPLVIADTAHNKEGLYYTMKQIEEQSFSKLRIVFGMVDDKSPEAILDLLPTDAEYYLCQPSIARAMPVEKLQELFENRKFFVKVFDSVKDAKLAAITDSQEDDMVYIGGSTFVVADAL
jgi:dihydrofolate synthase/folylpolyglutamate synthase